jgi:hypothetical protein
MHSCIRNYFDSRLDTPKKGSSARRIDSLGKIAAFNACWQITTEGEALRTPVR